MERSGREDYVFTAMSERLSRLLYRRSSRLDRSDNRSRSLELPPVVEKGSTSAKAGKKAPSNPERGNLGNRIPRRVDQADDLRRVPLPGYDYLNLTAKHDLFGQVF